MYFVPRVHGEKNTFKSTPSSLEIVGTAVSVLSGEMPKP